MSGLQDALREPHAFKAGSLDLQLGYLDTPAGWDLLAPHWQELHESTAGASVFQTLPYLRTWWDLLGSSGRLFIIVAMHGDRPVAIAPFQITRAKQLWSRARTISFIGQPSESDRPTVLGTADPQVMRALADYLLMLKRHWDSIVLFEQPVDSTLVQVLREQLRAARYLTAQIDGNECPYIDIRGSWADYLASRTKAFRKSIKRRRNQLEEMGKLEFESIANLADPTALQRYRAVEDKSWKRAQNLGIARSDKHWQFHQELSRREGPAAWMRFGFLKLDGQDIAATLGLIWRRRFYSLHVAHDAAQVDTSPGVVLTAMELEPLFSDHSCDHYDFLGGFLSNKRGWSSGSQHTTALFGDRPGLRSMAFHVLYFMLKPIARELLTRAGKMDQVSAALKKFRRSRKPPPVET